MTPVIISRKDISRLTSGVMPYALEGVPFIIMREKVSLLGSDNCTWEWNLSTSPAPNDCTDLTKEQAMKIIKAFHMEVSHQEGCGQIYELPGQPFLNTYRKPNRKTA